MDEEENRERALKGQNQASTCQFSHITTMSVNGAVFCGHGLEYCHKCTSDHRLTNNDDFGIDEFDSEGNRPAMGLMWPFELSKPNSEGQRVIHCGDHGVMGCKICGDTCKMAWRLFSTDTRAKRGQT